MQTIATIPHSDGLYHVLGSNEPGNREYASIASKKMTISEAHQKLGHIAHAAIKNAVKQGK